MISESELKKYANILDSYKNKEYESLTKLEKNKILSDMENEEIFSIEKEINFLIEEYKTYFKQYYTNFGLLKINSLSNYQRYYITAIYHHHLLSFRSYKNKDIEKKKKYFAVKEYEAFYKIRQELIKFIYSCIMKIENEKLSKKGLNDQNILPEEKVKAIKTSKNKIKSFLKKVKNTEQENQQEKNLLENINKYNTEEILKQITFNHLNFVKVGEIEKYNFILSNKTVSEKRREEIFLDILNGEIKVEEYNYEIFEQILLAPIKLRIFIENKHEKNKKSMNLERIDKYLKNICPLTDQQMEKIKNYEMHNKEFSKIGKNQVIPYCCTIFSEFFALNYYDLKRIYKLYYSEHPTGNTNFLKGPYEHIKEIEKNGEIHIEEFLPYLDNDEFKNIFYDIKEEPLFSYVSDKD